MRPLGLALILAVRPSRRLAAMQCPNGAPPPCAGTSRALPPTVAVMPFENRARDTSLTVLAEGVADEIATNLAKVSRLRVTSPASVRYALSSRGQRSAPYRHHARRRLAGRGVIPDGTLSFVGAA